MESSFETSYLGPICAFGNSVTWAIGSTAYSRLSKQSSAFAVNFARALVALPLFILAAFFVSGSWTNGIAHFQSVRLTHWGWFTLSMIASYGLGDVLFLWSTRSLGVPGALSIASCNPIWTAIGGYVFANETLSRFQQLGLVIATIGIVIVVLNSPQNSTPNDDIHRSRTRKLPVSGLLLALATSFAWATNSFATARGGGDLIPPVGNTIRMILALVLSAGFSRILAPQSSILLPKEVMKKSIWLFVLEAFGGSYLYMYGVSHTPLAIGSTLVSLSPVISVPVSWLLGLEKFSIIRTLGIMSVVFGVWLLLQSS